MNERLYHNYIEREIILIDELHSKFCNLVRKGYTFIKIQEELNVSAYYIGKFLTIKYGSKNFMQARNAILGTKHRYRRPDFN